jgi:hypothetical protein
MPAIDIPDPLPPAITPPRTVIEFLISQDLEEFGDMRLITRQDGAYMHAAAGDRRYRH